MDVLCKKKPNIAYSQFKSVPKLEDLVRGGTPVGFVLILNMTKLQQHPSVKIQVRKTFLKL